MNIQKRTYTAQNVIDLFDGDQPHVFHLVADALNSSADVGQILKREIQYADLDVQDALSAFEELTNRFN